jgi:hypothetical protein
VHVPYADIPRFPQATVAGHGTELVFGTLGGRRVVAQRGRFHAYEGHSMQRVAVPVRVFAALGCRVMLATNAAGGVNGMQIVPVVEDPASDPATFAEKARKLVVGDKCVSVFGSYTSASRKAVLRLKRIEIVRQGPHAVWRICLRLHDAVWLHPDDRLQIGKCIGAVERIDTDPQLRRACAGWAVCQKGSHKVAGGGLPVGGDRIFQIKDQRVGTAAVRFGELLLIVTGNEQPGPWRGFVHQIASCASRFKRCLNACHEKPTACRAA